MEHGRVVQKSSFGKLGGQAEPQLSSEKSLDPKSPVLIISLEMPAHDAWLRCASAYSMHNESTPTFSWSSSKMHSDVTVEYGGPNLSSGGDPIITAARVMAENKVPLMIAEPSSPDISTVCDLLVRASDAGARVAVLDYMQLVDTPGIDREHERIGTVMRSIVNVAKTCNLGIINIAAMNREGLTGTPSMHSAAGSSLIEYASTCVMTYTRSANDNNTDGSRSMLLDIQKNRNGMVTLSPINIKYWPAFNWVEEVT